MSIILCAVAGSALSPAVAGGAPPEEYQAEWESVAGYNQSPEWFRDAKFGIYTHWGPVTVGSENGPDGAQWYGRHMYNTNSPTFAYHAATFGDQNEVGYKDIITRFDPGSFDAEEWARIFAGSGARFAGPVVIHHDNYALWDSAFTRWDSMDTLPKRDFTAELEKAIRQEGMKFIATFHHAFAWDYFDMSYGYDGADPQYADLYGEKHGPKSRPPTDRYLEVWLNMINEVVDKYQPDLIWFDFGLGSVIPHNYQKQMFADYYNRAERQGREVGVAHKHWDIHKHAGIIDFERGRMDHMTEFPWLTDTSVGPWFHQNSHDYKTANQLIDVLVDIVSKNGCMLLNVGPDAQGAIPPKAQQLLQEMGQWLEVNGEAIYATRPWLVHGEGPTRMQKSGGFSERNDRGYTAHDIRYTRSKDGRTLYAIALGWPGSRLRLSLVCAQSPAANASVKLLGSDQPIPFSLNTDGQLVLDLGDVPEETMKSNHAHAFRLRGFEVGLHASASFMLPGTVILDPGRATLEGPKIRTEKAQEREYLAAWDDPTAKAHWLVKINEPGDWRIRGEFSCANGDGRLTVALNGQQRSAVIPRTQGWFHPVWIDLGEFTFKESGVYHLTLKAANPDGWTPVNVYQLQLASKAGGH